MMVAVDEGRVSAWSVAVAGVAAATALMKSDWRAVPEPSAAVLISTVKPAVAMAAVA